MLELVNAFEIVVRACDSRKNYQPEHFSWCVDHLYGVGYGEN